jgi:ectoine hydroxylase-related dioxygenase (phytanoyl-CoA dioxygenase family)
VKVFAFPFGTRVDQGPTCVLPGSHRLPNGPQAVGHVTREAHLYRPTLGMRFQGV